MLLNNSNIAGLVVDDDIPEVLCVVNGDADDYWIMDSGCTFHVCPNRSCFNEFKPMDVDAVMLENNDV